MHAQALTADVRPDSRRNLEPLFSPQSVAVIGASRKPGTVGNGVTRNLILGGFKGVIYPVNPNAKSVLGIRCVPHVSALDETVDLAVVIVPAPVVAQTVQECADLGTRHFIVISAGFKEIGGEGRSREAQLSELANERGLSILGPNCLGVINTAGDVSMNATFARDMPRQGEIGLLSQSGALCTALLDYAKGRGIGFSRFVSFGNKADIDETDLLWALARDSATRVILMYIEDISDGQRFIETAYEITHGSNSKPVLAIKTGRTPQGAAAAASHTGSLAGSDSVYDAIMLQAGVMRVESVKDLFDYARCFADQVFAKGRRTAIVTNAGGPGIMATDACVRSDLQLASFRDYTTKSLRFQLPPTSNIHNPVDVIGDARHDRYRVALDAVCADENVDQVVVIFAPQSISDVTEVAEVIAETKEFSAKPIVACLMGLVDVAPGFEVLKKKGVPAYIFPEDAVRSLASKNRYTEWAESPTSDYKRFDVNSQDVSALLASEVTAGRSHIVELKALQVLQHYGFPVVPFQLAVDQDQAVQAAEQVGYPVAMKVASPKILHKTEVGGVRLDLPDAAAVREAFGSMMDSVREGIGAEAEVWGILVQKMMPQGKEVILGSSRDERFGPLLMFGLGGIYTEAIKDVSFRLAPIRQDTASQMIKEIRAYRLLEGIRGESPSDVGAVADCLMRLSQLVCAHDNIKELDINPLIVYPQGQGAVVADARIILAEDPDA